MLPNQPVRCWTKLKIFLKGGKKFLILSAMPHMCHTQVYDSWDQTYLICTNVIQVKLDFIYGWKPGTLNLLVLLYCCFRLSGGQTSSFKHGPLHRDRTAGRKYIIVGANTWGWSSCCSKTGIESLKPKLKFAAWGVKCWLAESIRMKPSVVKSFFSPFKCFEKIDPL